MIFSLCPAACDQMRGARCSVRPIPGRGASRETTMTTARTPRSPGQRQKTSLAGAPARAVRLPAARLSCIDRSTCEAVLARNSVGRIAFAHHAHVNISPATYVYADGWLFARADAALRVALRHNRWVAIEVAEVRDVSDWQSVVVRGACYATSRSGSTAEDATIARGVTLLRSHIPEMSRAGGESPFSTTIFRVHADEVTGYRAIPAPTPRGGSSRVRQSRRAGNRSPRTHRER